MADRNYGVYNVWIGAPIERAEKPIGVSAFGLDYPGGPANISSLGQDITVYWDIFGPFGYGYGRQPWGTTPWGGSFPEIFLGVLVEVYMPTLRGQKTLVRRVSLGPRAMNYTYREDENRHDAAKLGHKDFQPVIEVAVGILTTAGKGGTWEAGASARVTTINGGPIEPPARHHHRVGEIKPVLESHLLGRGDGDGLGPAEQIALGPGLFMLGTTLNITYQAEGRFRYATSITMADPGSGKLRGNSATSSLITQLAISSTSDLGIDASTILKTLLSGDNITIQDLDNSAKWLRFSLTAVPTDNGTWFQLAVSYVTGAGTPPSNNEELLVIISGAGGGGGGAVTDHGALTGLLDDDHGQYAHLAPQDTARNTIAAFTGIVVPATIKGAASQTANLLDFRTNATTLVARVDKDGKIFGTGLDAGTQLITNVLTPASASDAATKGYVDAKTYTHASLTGLTADDHGQYIFNAPTTNARNTITPPFGFGTIVPLTLKGAVSHSTNLLECQTNAGAVVASVDQTGRVIGFGFSASSQKIINVLTPTAPNDAATKGYVDGLIPTVVTDHGLLTGLTDDDHGQYTVIAPAVNTRNTLQPTAGTVTPFIIKAHAAQSVDLQQWQSSAAAVLAGVNTSGRIYATGFDALSQKITSVLTPTNPTDAATKGYVDTSDTAAITSALGQAVILAPGTSAKNTVQPTGAAIIPLTIKGFASQTADLQNWQNSAAAVLAKVTSAGKFFAVGLDAGSQKVENVALCTVTTDGANKSYVDSQDTITAGLCVLKGPGTSLTNIVQPTGATIIPLTIRGFASQTGNLVEWQNSGSAVIARVTAAGKIFATGLDAGSQKVENVATPTVGTDAVNKTYADGLVVGGGDHGTLAGLGDDDHAQYLFNAPATSARNTLQPSAGTAIPLTIKGHASQSVDLQSWQSSAAAVLAKVTSVGKLFAVGMDAGSQKIENVALPTNTTDAASKTYVDSQDTNTAALAILRAPGASATNVLQPSAGTALPLTIKGHASQATDLQNWQNSGATVLAKVTVAGKIHGVGLDAGSQLITNVLTPAAGTDAANRTYVLTTLGTHIGADDHDQYVFKSPDTPVRNIIQPTTDIVALTVKAFGSGSEDLQQWSDPTLGVMAGVTANGQIYGSGLNSMGSKVVSVATPTVASDAATKGYVDGAVGSPTGAVILLPTTSARNTVQPSGAAFIPLTIKGFASQTADLQNWQSSAAAVLAKVTSAGKVFGLGLDAGSQLITNVLTPSAGTDAVNKSYADLLPAANGISNLQLRDSVALSLMGRSLNSGGDPGDIATTALSNAVMRESGSAIGWGLLASANLSASAGITNGQLANSLALSLMGRSANSVGVVSDIATTAASNAVLRESGSTIGWGLLGTSNLAAAAGITRGQLANGTALSVVGVTGAVAGALADIATTNGSGMVIREAGGSVGWGLIANANISAAAGINKTKFENSAALSIAGRSANSIGALADIATTAASNAVLRESGSTVGWGLLASANLATAAGITRGQLANGTACSVVGRSANSAGALADIAASADGQVLVRAGGVVQWAAPSTSYIAHQKVYDGPAMWGEATVGTPTLIQTNPTAFNATSANNHFVGHLMGDAKISWLRFGFVVPANHLAGTGFTPRICFVLNGAPAAGNVIELSIVSTLLADNDNLTGGIGIFNTSTFLLTGYAGSDYVIADFSAITAGFTPGLYYQGVIQRDARGAVDTYADLIGIAWISFRGTRAVL